MSLTTEQQLKKIKQLNKKFSIVPDVKINFGKKHKGESLEHVLKVDPQYLIWALEQNEEIMSNRMRDNIERGLEYVQ